MHQITFSIWSKNHLLILNYEYIIITGVIEMPRPCKCRFINADPRFICFKPRGVPLKGLELVELGLDELEALRLADLQGLYQTDAASDMGISQATFGRLLEKAHNKVADALINGKALMIKGGKVMHRGRIFTCVSCKKDFTEPFGTGRPEKCPHCGATSFHRSESDRGNGMGMGRGRCSRGMGGIQALENETEVEGKEEENK
jgi:uncharacterized protein